MKFESDVVMNDDCYYNNENRYEEEYDAIKILRSLIIICAGYIHMINIILTSDLHILQSPLDEVDLLFDELYFI